MRRHVLLVLLISCVIATPARCAMHDFASLRKAADDVAAKEKPGFQFLRVELTASHSRGSLRIHDSEFHYYGPIEPLTLGAITGKAQSHCHGADSKPMPC